METKLEILGFAGSLRIGSYNICSFATPWSNTCNSAVGAAGAYLLSHPN